MLYPIIIFYIIIHKMFVTWRACLPCPALPCLSSALFSLFEWVSEWLRSKSFCCCVALPHSQYPSESINQSIPRYYIVYFLYSLRLFSILNQSYKFSFVAWYMRTGYSIMERIVLKKKEKKCIAKSIKIIKREREREREEERKRVS